MDPAEAYGLLALAAVLASSSLYAVNKVAPGLSASYMKIHCLTGLASLAFTALHAAASVPSMAGDWATLTNLGLALVIAGTGILLRYIPDAGQYRFHSATLHPALALALLVSLLFRVLA
jgi:hypothetical protein